MKKIIEQLKERGIDKKLQSVMDFAKVTGLNETSSYEKALHRTFMNMVEEQEEEFEDEVIECVFEEGLKVLFEELNVQPLQDVEVDNEIKTLFSGLNKLRDLMMKGEEK